MMFVFWSKRFLIGWSQYDFIAEWFWIYINFFLEIWKCLTLLLLFFISTNTLWSGARDYIIIVCLFLFIYDRNGFWLVDGNMSSWPNGSEYTTLFRNGKMFDLIIILFFCLYIHFLIGSTGLYKNCLFLFINLIGW